ncbi:MAG: hypothetical protein EZS28_022565 [Streblomastix strix]|uniref:Uncharacterized protein n=1 Tax=Streblomastix strix TaxID=222440 RepID=A0A5J4VHA0_9EUKA|nr:MAG: hypothetical protein EZS28_022565 [Streblomastix strix]
MLTDPISTPKRLQKTSTLFKDSDKENFKSRPDAKTLKRFASAIKEIKWDKDKLPVTEMGLNERTCWNQEFYDNILPKLSQVPAKETMQYLYEHTEIGRDIRNNAISEYKGL